MTDTQVSTNGSEASGDTVNTTVNSESDPPSALEIKIIRQIEYYFGDINLSKDKFLQEQIKLDDGWIPVETMLKFNRLAYLSKEEAVIVCALEKSDSGLMEISEDKKKLRRSPNRPIPEMNENRRKEVMARTVYCKGFPKDSTNMDKLLDYFQQYGKIDNVVMRNWHDKATKSWLFKGSIFVVFPSSSEAESFLKQESVKYEDAELIKMSQEDYIEMKRKERAGKGKNKKSESKEEDGGDNAQPNQEKEKESFVDKFPSGCVVHLTGLNQNISRENIKEKIEDLGFSVAYVDFNKGDEKGWVRLDEQDSAKELVKKLEENEGKIKVNDVEIPVTSLNEEEETAYMQGVKEALSKKRLAGKGRKRGKHGGRGGKGGWNMRKRKGSPSEEGPTPAKVKAENCD